VFAAYNEAALLCNASPIPALSIGKLFALLVTLLFKNKRDRSFLPISHVS